MIICINPSCNKPENNDSLSRCESCGSELIINNRFKLIRHVHNSDDVDVYEAIDITGTYNSAPNQIKILKVLKSGSGARRDLFRRGSQLSMSLIHRGIPRVDVDDFLEVSLAGRQEPLLCLAMEMIEGQTLTSWVQTNGKITQSQAIAWMQQTAEILDFVHTQGILHRDIKPDNIMVRPNGDVALIDFDGARRMTSTYHAKLTRSDQPITAIVSGLYTAPEQIALKPVPQSDFYSLGMTFVFALTGVEPAAIPKIESTGRLSWFKFNRDVDPPFVKFINNLIHPSVTLRPSNSVELVNSLFVSLPRKLKRYRILRSKFFRLACIALLVFSVILTFNAGRNALYESYFTSGNRAVEDNQFVDARQKFESSINILPKAEAYSNLGVVCSRLGDLVCAFGAYQNAIKLNPKGWEGYYQLGSYFEEKAQPDILKAETFYRQALSLNPQAVQPLNNLSRVLILQKRYQEAKPIIINALTLVSEPYFIAVLNKNLGWLYLEQKQYSEAENYLKKAIALDSTLISPHCLLANLYEAQEKTSANEIQLCLTLNGEDVLNIEVLKWRNEMINKLLKNRSTSTSIYHS